MPFGDTYGPANYAAYVPFELAMPWSGEWDALPAAHAAAIFFDLATVLGLFVLGLRAGGGGGPGQRLGLILAFAWLTYPYTAFALQSNTNDSLVAALLVWGLVALGSPVGRGVLVGLAAMVKFAPLALVPLYAVGAPRIARGARSSGWRPSAGPAAPPVLLAGARGRVRDRAHARPPGGRPGPRHLLRAHGREPARPRRARSRSGARWTGSTACSASCWSRRRRSRSSSRSARRERTVAQVAALAAAVVIASQLAVDHWFYLYIPWFCGLVFVALALPAPGRRSAAAAEQKNS